ncbi:MAG: FAD-dependent oxidoreductase [Microgenomates group bacterium]
MIHQHIVILGAGPCGLGAAWELKKKGATTSFHVYEATDHVGGLSSSVTDAKGFTWDIGGHVFHTDNQRMQKLFLQLLGKNYSTYVRNASVLIGKTTVPYPFQYSVSLLPEKIKHACLVGLLETKTKKIPVSFSDWILKNFGRGMAKYFFVPYNQKLWRTPLTKMTWQWIDGRVATAHEKNKGTSWGRNASFLVPRIGGIGALWTVMGEELREHITTNKWAVAIDAKLQVVTFQDGSQVHYDHVLSTLSLKTLIGMIQGVSLPSVHRLRSVGVYVVGIGIRGTVPSHLKNLHWMYVPSPEIPFFRVSVYSNYGKNNAPKGAWSLLFEVSYDGKKKLDEAACIRSVIQSAKQILCIPKDADIVDTFFTAAPVAYPIPTIGRDAILSNILPKLAHYHIQSLGRFGSWKYETGNMDHVCLQGMEWAEATV